MTKFLLPFLSMFCCSTIWGQQEYCTFASRSYNEKNYEKALEHINKCYESSKDVFDSKTYSLQGNILYALGAKGGEGALDYFHDAAKAFEEAIRLDSTDHKLTDDRKKRINSIFYSMSTHYQHSGVELYKARDFKAALTCFENAAEMLDVIGKSDVNLINNMAVCAEQINDYEKASHFYDLLIKTGEADENTYLNMLKILAETGQNTEYVMTLFDARKKYPTSKKLLVEEIDFYVSLGDGENALKAINDALEISPDDRELVYMLGTLHIELKELDKAEKVLTDLVKNEPAYFDAVFNLAGLYMNQGIVIHEAADLEKDLYKHEKGVKKAKEFYKKAMPYFEQALDLDPNNEHILRNLKFIYEEFAMYKETEEIKARLGG